MCGKFDNRGTWVLLQVVSPPYPNEIYLTPGALFGAVSAAVLREPSFRIASFRVAFPALCFGCAVLAAFPIGGCVAVESTARAGAFAIHAEGSCIL